MLKVVKHIITVLLSFLIVLIILWGCFLAVYPKKFTIEIQRYSKEYNLNLNFVYAVVKAESSFNHMVVSKSGAIGLMQIMPQTAVWIASELNEAFEIENLYNPEINIKYGCFYLRYLIDKFNNKTYALCAYNAGETVVRSWINSQSKFTILYPETKNYVKKVETAQKVYTILNKLSK